MSDRVQKQRGRAGNRQRYGELEATTCNLTLAVEPDNGSDDQEVGDTVTPFATIARAALRLQDNLWHKVRILISPGSDPSTILGAARLRGKIRVAKGGSLALIGVGEPVVLEDEIEVTDLTEADPRVTIAAVNAGTWAGYFLRIAVGKDAGAIMPILSCDETGFVTRNEAPLPEIGDTVEVVKPAVEWSADQVAIDLEDSAADEARLLLANMTIDLSESTDATPLVLRCNGSENGVQLQFVRILLPEGGEQ